MFYKMIFKSINNDDKLLETQIVKYTANNIIHILLLNNEMNLFIYLLYSAEAIFIMFI